MEMVSTFTFVFSKIDDERVLVERGVFARSGVMMSDFLGAEDEEWRVYI